MKEKATVDSCYETGQKVPGKGLKKRIKNLPESLEGSHIDLDDIAIPSTTKARQKETPEKLEIGFPGAFIGEGDAEALIFRKPIALDPNTPSDKSYVVVVATRKGTSARTIKATPEISTLIESRLNETAEDIQKRDEYFRRRTHGVEGCYPFDPLYPITSEDLLGEGKRGELEERQQSLHIFSHKTGFVEAIPLDPKILSPKAAKKAIAKAQT